MHAEDYRQAHGKRGIVMTDDGVGSATVYIAPELRLDPCPVCAGRLRIVGRFNQADGEPIPAHTVAECDDCHVGVMSEDA